MLLGAPSDATTSTSATFRFSASAGITSCRLDGGNFHRCSGPVSYSGLAQARHTFTVRATSRSAISTLQASWSIAAPITTALPAATTLSASTAMPAAFPSRLRASGRHIVDENGYVLPTLRGFNMHVGPGFTWSQRSFSDIATLGARINRAVIHWDQFEPREGVIDPTAIANLDLHIARAQAAGLYTLLELHLNVGRYPSWTSAKRTEIEKYAAYGGTLTQYLANRYGNPASAHYTKAVVGFGLNEPPLEDSTTRNGDRSIPYLEGKQRQMISWMRGPGHAPDWIGFVAYGYASATPIYDHRWQNARAVDASPTAYDSVGGNVVIDVHDYVVGCTNADPSCSGRQWNGMVYPTHQGGPMIGSGDSRAASYVSSTYRRAQLAAYLAPYKAFSERAQIPLMIGEWSWPGGSSDGLAWLADKQAAWAKAGTSIQIHWNYDVTANANVNPWAARPGGIWTPTVQSWATAS